MFIHMSNIPVSPSMFSGIASRLLLGCVCALGAETLKADFKDDIGFTKLKAEYGSSLPTGSGVLLAQVEYVRNNYWAPQAVTDLAGKNFTYITDTFGGYSSHAYDVGCYLGGATKSITPGVSGWTCFEATNYCSRQSLMAGRSLAPLAATWDIENHSWGGNDLINGITNLQRMDYRIERDNVIAVVGVDNGSTLSMMMANAYNVISVGTSTGDHPHCGSTLEVKGRMKPELVGTATYTSYATPIVASCATLLVGEIKRSPALVAARSSLVIKALLMAGATKDEFSGWTHTATKPLDSIYGAGEVNIYNSYKALVAGRQQPLAATPLSINGWDANTASLSTRRLYYFSVPVGQKFTLSAVLTWNCHVQPDSTWQAPVSVVNNLDLALWKADGSYNLQNKVSISNSAIDNVEHIYEKSLTAGVYALEVVTPVDGEKYGLAWKGSLVADSSTTTPVSTPPPASTNQFACSGFESPSVGSNTSSAYAYNPTGTAWTFNGKSGVSGNKSAFTSNNPLAPEGTQVSFVQMTGSIVQNVQMTAGTYTITASAAQRGIYQAQSQTVDVFVDGAKVGTFAPSGTAYNAVKTGTFSVTDGSHAVKFTGLATADGTLFIDQVALQPVTVPAEVVSVSRVTILGSGFEAPSVGTNNSLAYAYRPTGSAWTFTGNSGLAGNNSAFTDRASVAPEGTQVAFLQQADSAISQTLSFATAGTYSLVVSAASRGGPYNQKLQIVHAWLDGKDIGTFSPSATSYQTTTLTFAATAGSHVLSFRGSVAADSTAFIDDIVIIGP